MLLTLKSWFGILLGLLSFAGLIVNIIVGIPVFRMAFIQNKSPIYVISFVNIFGDAINLSLAVLYLAPSIFLNSHLITNQKGDFIHKFLAAIFMFCWYLGTFTQSVMAINRLVVIYYRRNDIFTRKNILLIFGVLIPLCMFTSYMSQFGFPCCAFIYDHEVLSYSYYEIEGILNYPNTYFDLPLNFSSSTIATICYSIIVITVYKSRRGISGSLGIQLNHRTRRNREITYAMQFCFISMFYTFSWISFRLFPVLIGNSRAEWFISISIAVAINSSANAVIYLFCNQEVIRNLKSCGLNIFNKSGFSSTLQGPSSDSHNTVTQHQTVVIKY